MHYDILTDLSCKELLPSRASQLELFEDATGSVPNSEHCNPYRNKRAIQGRRFLSGNMLAYNLLLAPALH
jgi:hypothetical protein